MSKELKIRIFWNFPTIRVLMRRSDFLMVHSNPPLQVKFRLSIETLMDEIKPVNSEKFELEKRDKSIITAFLENSDDQEYDTYIEKIGF